MFREIVLLFHAIRIKARNDDGYHARLVYIDFVKWGRRKRQFLSGHYMNDRLGIALFRMKII